MKAKRLMMLTMFLGMVCLLFGCASTDLIFATGTTVGVKMTTTEGEVQKLKVAYDRTEFAYVPLKDKKPYTTTGSKGEKIHKTKQEAYSVYSGIFFRNKWWTFGQDRGLRLVEVFGTGEAANMLAKPRNTAMQNTVVAVTGFDLGKASAKPLAEFNRAYTEALSYIKDCSVNENKIKEGIKEFWPNKAKKVKNRKDVENFIRNPLNVNPDSMKDWEKLKKFNTKIKDAVND